MAKVIAGRYELVKCIGHGGMADVYLALDLILDRQVAIKILKPDSNADKVALERFAREAQASTQLSHPNIVDIYDVGDDDNIHYIVMEYVKGHTLKQLIKKRGPLPTRETIWIMKQLTSALMEAHKNGLIHRDIKSQNILIKDDGTVKLADFGIAILNNAIQLTSKDSVLGSVHYLAPELVKGEKSSMKSDIYSLGIVMYELLRGDVPFKGDNPAQIALKHMKQEIPNVREYNPQIPQSVANIITKACAKDPKDRYDNAALMLKDLNVCLNNDHLNDEAVHFENREVISDFSIPATAKTEIKKIKQKKKERNFSAVIILIITLFSVIALSLILMLSGILSGNQNNYIEVPEVKNLTLAQAKDTLDNLGLNIVYPLTYETTDDVEASRVVSIYPDSGSQVEKGSKVRLTISNGKFELMEDYSGKNYDAVFNELFDTNLKVSATYITNSDLTPGTIVDQSIKAGTKFDPYIKNEIIFTVVDAETMNVPIHLLGKNVYNMQIELSEQGFNVELREVDYDDLSSSQKEKYKEYEIINVDPGEGAQYIKKPDSKLILDYYVNSKED
ncbi:MAG: Stk1 family PASTA domain-containing Ser/Thr kinase [Solobacterium sp.]|nr:Stk1 family PASTA domain-containing Ser/Thr kinase [Solobacterium sp.]MDY4640512.1 Stk1 family PASTA domain-containing Ser/Thr kinase [Erysipelotrichaceae bacterium]MCI7732770.1 Stk1 family PASTA domain-containing Ser/Thr kinase [Solobacterium sp.]MDD5842224.1 Stk1 family PASTA domain-containing Ser/Thr kinase [Solobacterium sp.]MDD6121170.1 Stk1 family PASTA domain-containing Ser/Thr kinase [Solobacterium sp.]